MQIDRTRKPAKDGVNRIVIKLTVMDLYTVESWRIGARGLVPKRSVWTTRRRLMPRTCRTFGELTELYTRLQAPPALSRAIRLRRYLYIEFSGSPIVTHVSYSELRNNLAKYMDQVVQDRVELHVTRQDHPGVVMISEAEFEGWKETVHLLSSPANAVRIFEALAEIEAGTPLIPYEPGREG